MKSSAEVAVKGKFHQAKGKTKEESGKVMNDPTLEGKDENKVGRFQRKTRQADTGIKKCQGRAAPVASEEGALEFVIIGLLNSGYL